MNLVLIGYRGTGKSSVSQILAPDLGLEHRGMDAELVDRFGKSIPEFVEEQGWDAFRDEESKLAEEWGRIDGLLIDCGGGVIVRERNVESLKANGRVVWLTASVETIARRIEGDDQRPSLTGTQTFLEEIREVLEGRIPLYRKAADHVVDADRLSIEEAAAEIRRWWLEAESRTTAE